MDRMGNVGKYSNMLSRDAFKWGNAKILGEPWVKVARGALGEEKVFSALGNKKVWGINGEY